MRTLFAFLCDYAQDPGNGKIVAVGVGIDNFFVADLNQPAAPFHFVVSLEGTRNEAGAKQCQICLMDEDGKTVVPPFQKELPVLAPPVGLKTGMRVLLGFNGVKFPRYGPYVINLTIDGHEYANISFTVSKPPVPGGGHVQ
ncbi:MAG: DUF6941 family protein [Bacillota bacterium]